MSHPGRGKSPGSGSFSWLFKQQVLAPQGFIGLTFYLKLLGSCTEAVSIRKLHKHCTFPGSCMEAGTINKVHEGLRG